MRVAFNLSGDALYKVSPRGEILPLTLEEKTRAEVEFLYAQMDERQPAAEEFTE